MNLAAPKQTDPVIVIVLGSVGFVIVGAGLAVALVLRSSRKKIALQESIYKSKGIKPGSRK